MTILPTILLGRSQFDSKPWIKGAQMSSEIMRGRFQFSLRFFLEVIVMIAIALATMQFYGSFGPSGITHKDAASIKIGMTKSEVFWAIGWPDRKTKGTLNETWSFAYTAGPNNHDQHLDVVFDAGGRILTFHDRE